MRRPASLLFATALGALLSLMIEVAQVYVSVRVPSLKDLALNTLGAALGATGGLLWRVIAGFMHLPAREEPPARDPGAALLIVTWLVFRFAPFVPQLDLGKLKSALQPLFEPHWDAVSIFIYLTCWLVVNQAIASLVRRSRRLEMLLFVIAAVLLGRLLVANQTFVADELFALLLLLPMLVLLHRMTEDVRNVVLICAVAIVLVIEGLAPFDFVSEASRFDLWPFLVWFELGPSATIEAVDWTAVLGRLFLFSALMWMLRHAGMRINAAIGCAVGVALAIEIAQVWLPDQSGSLTDPALALAIGLLLRAMERSNASSLRGAISPPARNR